MIREQVRTSSRTYDLLIGPGVLETTGEFLRKADVPTASHHLLVTDQNVQAAGWADTVIRSLEAAGYRTTLHVIPPGESSKTLAQAETVLEAAYRAGLDRRSVLLALGGGVVGDLAGFVAATYMRGIDFVQLPTSLLAHDSAVGGKVAVNLPQAKNIVGAFHQPLGVLYDTNALKTLSPRELRSGLAEAIKHGVIRDADLFRWIADSLDLLLAGDNEAMSELLRRSCRIKAEIVAADERETGDVRALLNFGHTLGHAVEGLSPHGSCTHGEAVAIGMTAAAELSVELGLTHGKTAAALIELLRRADLPTSIPSGLSADEIIDSMRRDKKAVGGDLTFVLIRALGEAEIIRGVTEEHLRRIIKDMSNPWSARQSTPIRH